MADTKISAMPDASALTGAEYVPIVQSGANVKTTIGAIFTALAYGEMYVASGAVSQTTSATPNAWTKLTCFTTNGLNNNTTPDAANDQIVIANAGVYQVQFYNTFTATNNHTFAFRLYNQTTASPYVNTVVKSHSQSTNPMFVAYSAIVSVNAGDALIVQFASPDASQTITVSDANISVIQVSAA